MSIVRGPWPKDAYVVNVDDRLRMPLNRELRHRVRAVLRGGERTVVLNLAGVSSLDAAGVGELVRAYNMALAVNARVTIVHAGGAVSEILERVGLFGLLSAGPGTRLIDRPDSPDSSGACDSSGDSLQLA
jgi:anti-anti-sigma factor